MSSRSLLFQGLSLLPRTTVRMILTAGLASRTLWTAVERRRLFAWVSLWERSRMGQYQMALRILEFQGLVSVRAHSNLYEEPRERIDIEGTEHLKAAAGPGGVVILSFHVGLDGLAAMLRILGLPVFRMARDGLVSEPLDRTSSRDPANDIPFYDEVASRAAALYRVSRLLRDGQLVVMGGDTLKGSSSRQLCSVRIQNRSIGISEGWFLVRRRMGATVVPALVHRRGSQCVVTLHPPLPPVVPDLAVDTAACERALHQILSRFAEAHPEQCLDLVRHTSPVS